MRIGLVDVDGHNFPNLPLMKRKCKPTFDMVGTNRCGNLERKESEKFTGGKKHGK